MVKTNVRIIVAAGLVLALASSAALAALDMNDPSIISLYRLDEATSGNLNNSVDQSFADTAPTGTAQPHDDFDDGASDGPAWGGGANFAGTDTGAGLIFSKADNDRTRAEGWMHLSQGNYTQGKSFSIMARIYATEAVDNSVYPVFVNGYTSGLRLKGTSLGTLTVDLSLRDGGGNGETYWNITSGAAQPSVWWLDKDKWYNIFMIYEANTSLTVAADDGENYMSFTSTDVPADFDSLTYGFSDPSRHWFFGSNTTASGAYDGRMESVVIWDKALTEAEADATAVLAKEVMEAAAHLRVPLVVDTGLGDNWDEAH